MKVSVQFPLHTKSENANRRFGNPYARAHATKRERDTVRMILNSQLPRLRALLSCDPASGPRTRENFYRVTIIRIGAGLLDDDNVHGALKAVRDEIAAWLGIKDDHAAPASWRVGQQKAPPGVHAIRIEVEDDDPDPREVHRIVGPPIPKLGPVIGDCSHCGRPARDASACAGLEELGRIASQMAPRVKRRAWDPRKPLEQAPIVFRRSFYAPPGQDEDADEVTLEELTGPLFEAFLPPPRIMKGGRIFARRLDSHPALGEHWIYEPAPSAARAHEERTEARR